MQVTDLSPDKFIDDLPEDVREDIRILDAEISKLFKGQVRVMWEGKFWGGSDQKIIGYGDVTYVGSNKKEVKWFRAGLSNQKNYISLFVPAVEDRQYVAEKYKKELGKAKVGKSSISFTKLENINMDVLLKIVAASVNFVPPKR